MMLVLRFERGIELGAVVVSVAGIRHIGGPVAGKLEAGLLCANGHRLGGLEPVGKAVVVGPEHHIPAFGLEPEFVVVVPHLAALE